MRRALLASLGLLLLLLLPACSLTDEEPRGPRFEPGAYGGEPQPGTEELYNFAVSPDGKRVAFVRERTPGAPREPKR